MENKNLEKNYDVKITYYKLFWLFMLGSILGVILEGVWSIIRRGAWETHVVTIWEPLCIIYGIGLIVFYIASKYFKKYNVVLQFFLYLIVGSLLEYACGALLLNRLGMRAWNYRKQFLNINGHISLRMAIIWGILGVLFSYALPYIDKFLNKLNKRFLNIFSIVFGVFVAADLVFSSVCMVRWRDRHNGIDASNKLEIYIDNKYDNEFMENRYMEWWFVKKK